LDPVVVHHALAGVDVVIQSLGVPVSGIDRPASSIVFRGDALLVAAMKKAGTKRLICVTGFGAGDSRAGLLYDAAFCLLLGRAYEDKDYRSRSSVEAASNGL
jgi:putative NADH-flavin reductase